MDQISPAPSTSGYPEVPSPVIELELSSSDLTEAEKVNTFFSNGCACKLGPKGANCSSVLSRNLAVTTRNNCLQLERNELDLVILSQIQALRTHPDQPTGERRSSGLHMSFFFHKLRVCLNTFLFIHGINHKRFEALQKHLDSDGLLPRVHGNVKRLPFNTRPPEDTFRTLGFIDNFSEIHGLPLPGRMPNHRDSDVVILPSDMSKSYVYRKYAEGCEKSGEYCFSRRKFEELWQELRPYVVTNKPATDLCLTCQLNNDKISKGFALSEEDREQLHLSAATHLSQARSERHNYRSQCELASTQWKEHTEKTPRLPYLGEMHYSFDYAQQIHYPYNDQQPGPAYFLTARKCQLFGVCSEAQGKQINYLVDEADVTGKGANTTISYVHHFLENYSVGAHKIKLHCDNCVGQNKNNAFIFYFLWRVITGREKSVTLSFMVAGHTKFSCDRYFGLIKKKYRRSKIDTMHGISRVVSESSAGYNMPMPVRNTITGELEVRVYDWVAFFHSLEFKTVPNILRYHVFRFDQANLQVVFVKEYSTESEVYVQILKSTPAFDKTLLPLHIVPKGLDLERQWYLYEKIRILCHSNLSRDITCPEPPEPKKKSKSGLGESSSATSTSGSTTANKSHSQSKAGTTEPSATEQLGTPAPPIPTLGSKRKRLCSTCSNPGHNKKTCPNKQ
ncbi:hypothetical protein SPONL_198 [uncultured Candidatus Thioglobus sp.]|nr:hypothetical protein SPONL_198 [uncultured Candidatus Thioglobus sp.]